jgi:hypothetical protein
MPASADNLIIDRDDVGATHADSFPSRFNVLSSPTLGPGRCARLLARARAGSLDRQLIDGADIAGSAWLSARAATLTEPRTRALIAEGLDRLLRAAQGPHKRWCAIALRGPLLANREAMGELAALLRGPAPVHARGIAILSELLRDGTGPAYRGSGEDLARRLGEAQAAMH